MRLSGVLDQLEKISRSQDRPFRRLLSVGKETVRGRQVSHPVENQCLPQACRFPPGMPMRWFMWTEFRKAQLQVSELQLVEKAIQVIAGLLLVGANVLPGPGQLWDINHGDGPCAYHRVVLSPPRPYPF